MLRTVLAILLIPSLCFGANFYVDPTYNGANGSGNGSYSRPWTTIDQVNNYSFSTSDDLYFRAGTRLYMKNRLRINWSGKANNRVVVGAFYGENKFGLGGKARPILDGLKNTVPTKGSYSGLIEARDIAGYVTIKDLEIRDSGGAGIRLGNNSSATSFKNTYCTISNCTITRPWRRGIEVARSSYNLIENNKISYPSYGQNKPDRIMGAGIEITGMNNESLTQNNVVRGNTVHGGSAEGIGLYQRARYNIVENNIVYDCRTYHIYLDKTKNNTVRNNLVYSTAGGDTGSGIAVASELHVYEYESSLGWHDIHDNYIAGLRNGIKVSIPDGAKEGHKNISIYNNRLVDNYKNLNFSNDNIGDWADNKIYRNYSFIFTAGLKHSGDMSPRSFTWDRNYYNNNYSTVTGNAARNAIFNNISLQKTSGWGNLQPGQVDKSFFAFGGETSSSSPNTPPNLRIE